MLIPSKEFIDHFKKTEGALSVTESIAILNLASEAPEGTYIELGTYFGKSAMSAAATLKEGIFHLVDPLFKNTEIAKTVAINVYRVTKKDITIDMIGEQSTDILPRLNSFSWVFVDSGSHGDGLPMKEMLLLEDRVIQGGIVAFHDYNSQFREVKEAHEYLIGTGKYENIPINWDEIIDFVRQGGLENGNCTWHHTEVEFPAFVGAVKRK